MEIDSAIVLLAARIDGDTRDDLVGITDHDRRLFWLRGTAGGLEPVRSGAASTTVRSGKWKAVKRGNNPLELYDLENDLRETTNVAAANPAVAAEMQQVITREFMPDLNEPKPSAGSPVYPNDP